MRTNAEIVVPSSSYSQTETFHDIRLDSTTSQTGLTRPNRTKSGSYCGGAVDPRLLSQNPPEDGLAVPDSDPGRVPSAEFPSSEVVHRICTSPDGLDPTGRWHVVDPGESSPRTWRLDHYFWPINQHNSAEQPTDRTPDTVRTLHPAPQPSQQNPRRHFLQRQGKSNWRPKHQHQQWRRTPLPLTGTPQFPSRPPRRLHRSAGLFRPTLNPALTDADTASQDSLPAHTSPLSRVRRHNEPIQRPAATYFPRPPFARHPSASSSMRPLVDRDRFLSQTADRTRRPGARAARPTTSSPPATSPPPPREGQREPAPALGHRAPRRAGDGQQPVLPLLR